MILEESPSTFAGLASSKTDWGEFCGVCWYSSLMLAERWMDGWTELRESGK